MNADSFSVGPSHPDIIGPPLRLGRLVYFSEGVKNWSSHQCGCNRGVLNSLKNPVVSFLYHGFGERSIVFHVIQLDLSFIYFILFIHKACNGSFVCFSNINCFVAFKRFECFTLNRW